MSMNELSLLHGQIDRLISDLVDLDMKLAKATGNVSVGFSAIKDIKMNLANNARKAVFSPKVTTRDRMIHNSVVTCGHSIKATAKEYGVSQSTVRRAMDRVTEMDCKLSREF